MAPKPLRVLAFALLTASAAFAPLYAQTLTAAEENYLASLGPVRMCVDPDWYPFERITAGGMYEGIGADLVSLVAERLGMDLVLVPTADWKASVEYAKAGSCDILPFLNKSPARDEWLIFTEPYFTDANVIITREEHDYIPNLAGLRGETVALPEGTSVEERVRSDYPHLQVITTATEADAFALVEQKKADLTLRSLTIAAYTIKKDGWFNLKIAGEVPAYANRLRIGVVSDKPLLREILDKGVATITAEDVHSIVNRHVSITVAHRVDYALIIRISTAFAVIFILGALWAFQLRALNQKLLEATHKLQHMADYDNLTQLPNRALFTDRLRQSLLLLRRSNAALAVLFVDLDGFKQVNDRFGHEAGDLVLAEAARRIRTSIRESDTAARIGGDEFVVLVNFVNSRESIEKVAAKICSRIADPFEFDGEMALITASIGIAFYPDHGETEAELLKNADSAMYRMKKSGKNGVATYKPPVPRASASQ